MPCLYLPTYPPTYLPTYLPTHMHMLAVLGIPRRELHRPMALQFLDPHHVCGSYWGGPASDWRDYHICASLCAVEEYPGPVCPHGYYFSAYCGILISVVCMIYEYVCVYIFVYSICMHVYMYIIYTCVYIYIYPPGGRIKLVDPRVIKK